MTFRLHSQLNKDCLHIGDFPLCRLLLNKNKRLPWFILVPRKPNIREIYELNQEEQQQFLRESSHLSEIIMDEFKGDKLNVAALGNMVPQLHIHHIVRYRHYPVWPSPVWGNLEEKHYSNDEIKPLVRKTQQLFVNQKITFTPC